MKTKPLIAVTPSYSADRKIRLSPAYLDAIYACGGIGAVLPYTDRMSTVTSYVNTFDGFLFSGGVDIDPAFYGEAKAFDSVDIDRERDRFELLLFREAVKTKKPILGICRGIQLLNVACGGSLVQHMEGHMQAESVSVPTHRVKLLPHSRLAALLKTQELAVNSFHHQAVKTVAPSLRATAFAEDGTVEAVECESHPFLIGIQWHPELMCTAEAHARTLFLAFTAACTVRQS